MKVLIGLILGNAVLTLLWAAIRISRKQNAWMAVLFFLLPWFGFLIYGVPKLVWKCAKTTGYDRESLVGRHQVERAAQKLDEKLAFDVVPVQDALTWGSNHEKRRLLLEQMKQGIDTRYQTIKQAGSDSDSESVHYVSAAKMELYNRHYEELAAAQRAWDEQPEDPERKQRLLGVLRHFLDSDLLQQVETELYLTRYCDLFDPEDEGNEPENYRAYLDYCCRLGLRDQIDAQLKKEKSALWDFETFKTLLRYFYDQKDSQRFYLVLQWLKESSLVLDQEGIELITNWQEGRVKDAVN